MALKAILTACVAFILCGCAATDSQVALPTLTSYSAQDSTVCANIPSTLAPSQRTSLAAALDALPAEDRASVVLYQPDGGIITNDNALTFEPSQSSNAFDTATAANPLDAVSAVTPNDASAGTGPIVRRQEAGGSGHTFFEASVNLPCSSTMLQQIPEGGAFIYMSFFSPGGQQLEQGFDIHAPGGRPGTPTSIEPYFREQTRAETGYKSSPHYSCDQVVVFKNYLAQASASTPTMGVECITGQLNSSTVLKKTCYMHKTTPSFNYSQVCPACYLRWLGGVAFSPRDQSGRYRVPLTYFAVMSPQNKQQEKGELTWSDVTVGSFSSFGFKATPQTRPWQGGSVALAPSNGLSTGVLIDNVTSTAPWNETMGFNLYDATVVAH